MLGTFITLDPVGVALGTMTGLTLGVGFALLILDRFHREEWPDGVHAARCRHGGAARAREHRQGRPRRGHRPIVALALVAVDRPDRADGVARHRGAHLRAFATGGAVVVMPAALVLLGRRIDASASRRPRPSRAYGRACSTAATG